MPAQLPVASPFSVEVNVTVRRDDQCSASGLRDAIEELIAPGLAADQECDVRFRKHNGSVLPPLRDCFSVALPCGHTDLLHRRQHTRRRSVERKVGMSSSRWQLGRTLLRTAAAINPPDQGKPRRDAVEVRCDASDQPPLLSVVVDLKIARRKDK